MEATNKQKYFHAYQTFKFQENNTDSFSNASIKRKLLALNYYSSIHTKKSNYATEFLLNESLRDYSRIVDYKESGQINNYADYTLSVLSNFQNDDKKNWVSHLEEVNVSKLLKPLSCSNNTLCQNSEFDCKDLEEFEVALNQYKKKECVKNFPPKNFVQQINSNNEEKNNGFYSKAFIPPTNKANNEQIRVFETNKISKKEIAQPSEQCNSRKNLFFQTAKDNLIAQNAKKFGKDKGNKEESYNYGVVKKSLGTRKGGVYGKFQPPIRNKENEEDLQSKMDVDGEVDERLKNIDPAMIEIIKNEIMDCGSKITWDDIAGLHLAKKTIQEIVVWPMLRPDIFTGLRRPPNGILLFGPPGTGKTLIGKCIASQSNSTFFSISASSLTSKWVGDGEKMVRTLFAVAKVHQPSVVFIDEIDSLLSQRSDTEHESSRRIKTEFLVQLDGAGTGDEDRILIIGATNRPQELDEAARRRLVKRLYIPLPDKEARKQIIENLISTEKHCLSESEIEHIAELTEGYSGADVKNLCQEASLGPIRSIPPSKIQNINPEEVRALNVKDFESALCRIKSSVSEKDLNIYVAWDKQYGCGSAQF